LCLFYFPPKSLTAPTGCRALSGWSQSGRSSCCRSERWPTSVRKPERWILSSFLRRSESFEPRSAVLAGQLAGLPARRHDNAGQHQREADDVEQLRALAEKG